MKKTSKRNDKKASEKQVVKRKSVSWASSDVVTILAKVNDGSLSVDAAAEKLRTKPYYVGVRSGWLKQFGTAAEPKETGALGKGAKKKRTAKKTK